MWYIGVISSLVGNIFLNVGLNIQKLGLVRRHWVLWSAGFFLFLLGNLGDFIAFKFTAQSVITVLGSSSILTNAIIAPIINNEAIGMRDYIASFLIVAGSAMVILFSDHRDIDYSVCDLVQLYRRPSVIAILCVLVALGTGLFIFILFGEKRISTLKAASLSAATSPTVDQSFLGSPKSDTFPKIANLEAPSSTADLDPRKHGSAWIRYGLPFAYATLGAVFGAITVVLAKSSSELLATLFKKEEDAAAGKNVTVVDLTGEGAPRSTCDMGGVSVYAFGWSIAAALAFCAVVQIICINASLKRYDALTQVPLYYVIWTLLGNFMGAVYFDEFQNFTPLRIVFFCFGISLNVAGVFIISSRFSDEGGEDGGGKDVTSEEDDMNPSKDEKSPIIA